MAAKAKAGEGRQLPNMHGKRAGAERHKKGRKSHRQGASRMRAQLSSLWGRGLAFSGWRSAGAAKLLTATGVSQGAVEPRHLRARPAHAKGGVRLCAVADRSAHCTRAFAALLIEGAPR
jgi:hypothetical protein